MPTNNEFSFHSSVYRYEDFASDPTVHSSQVLDFFGGAKTVPVDKYFAATPY